MAARPIVLAARPARERYGCAGEEVTPPFTVEPAEPPRPARPEPCELDEPVTGTRSRLIGVWCVGAECVRVGVGVECVRVGAGVAVCRGATGVRGRSGWFTNTGLVGTVTGRLCLGAVLCFGFLARSWLDTRRCWSRAVLVCSAITSTEDVRLATRAGAPN